MSNVGNALRMLVLLKSRGKMSLSELSEILEMGKRQIIRYKEALEDAGINIRTIPGKYGGYAYDDKEYLSSLNLTDDEFIAILAAEQQLTHDNFVNLNDFKKLVEKISSLKKREEVTISDYYIKSKGINLEIDKEKKAWLDINSAIVTNRKIKLNYESLKNESVERTVRPYAVFQYEGALYLVGYCEIREAMREFKLSRIKSYEILNDKFSKDKGFKLQDYLRSSFGIYKEGHIEIKLKIKYPMSQIVKEKAWVENQKITELEDNSIIFEASMIGETEIKSWILSMGSSAEVIEPMKLKQVIVTELQNTINLYK
ncbi:HTH domain protein [Clostridiales bacterium oral taxon 876 str. F0540]|nr:HTH domain protein [Clostridiales bacterium oral taxon 876 str. F0540]